MDAQTEKYITENGGSIEPVLTEDEAALVFVAFGKLVDAGCLSQKELDAPALLSELVIAFAKAKHGIKTSRMVTLGSTKLETNLTIL